MRKVAILSACGFVAALALVACGGSSTRGSTPAASADAPCTNGATATAAAAPQPYHEGTAVPFIPPDDEAQCRLRRALLTREELPSGLSEALQGPVYGSRLLDCGVQSPAPASGVMDQFFAANASDALAGVSEWVFAFKPGDAAGLIRTLKQRCASLADGGDPNGPNHVIDMPLFGDESLAVRLVGPAVGTIYIRRGDLVTVLLIGTKGDLAAGLSQLAAKADAKLETVGPIPSASSSPASDTTDVAP